MIDFLRNLFGMCVHTYETEHKFEVVTRYTGAVIGYKFIDKCTKCNHRKVISIGFD